MEEEKKGPKFHLPEIILIGLILFVVDLIELIAIFTGPFSALVVWIINLIMAMIYLYLWFRGFGFINRASLQWLIEWIPYVGVLPLLTIGFGALVYANKHPESAVAKIVKVGQAVSSKGKGLPNQTTQISQKAVGAEKNAVKSVTDIKSKSWTPEKEATENLEDYSIPEESFGMEKESIEKIIDITRNLPEPESDLIEEDEEENYRQAA